MKGQVRTAATLRPVGERAPLVTHLSPKPLVAAQARQALDQLREKGWAVGPPADPESWRRELRAGARREGLRVRTGTATAPSGDVCPWAIATAQIEPLAALMGGIELEGVGAALVATQGVSAKAQSSQVRWVTVGTWLPENRRARTSESCSKQSRSAAGASKNRLAIATFTRQNVSAGATWSTYIRPPRGRTMPGTSSPTCEVPAGRTKG